MASRLATADREARADRLAARSWGRRLVVGAFLALVLLLAAAGWLGIRAVAAARHLRAARDSLTSAKASLTQARFSDAELDVRQAAADTAAARRLTGDPIWSAAGALPLIGNTFTVSRGLASGADEIASTVLPGVLIAVDRLDPAALRRRNGTVNPGLLRQLAPALTVAAGQAREVDARTAALPRGNLPAALDSARVAFQTQAQQLATALTAAAGA